MDQNLQLRDKYAQERTLLANERTMLAHIRTALALFLFGVAILKLFENWSFSIYIGILAIIAGFIFLIIGLTYYPIRKRKIKNINNSDQK